jgi:hypothetical protein
VSEISLPTSAHSSSLAGAGMHQSLQRSSSKRLDVLSIRGVFFKKVANSLAGKIAWQLRKNLILQRQQKKDKSPPPQEASESILSGRLKVNEFPSAAAREICCAQRTVVG